MNGAIAFEMVRRGPKPSESVQRVIESVLLDDPSVTPAQAAANRRAKPADPLVNRSWVARNSLTTIGALAFIRRRRQHQSQAAQRFLNYWETAFGGVSPALDPNKQRVDTSHGSDHDGAVIGRIDSIRAVEKCRSLLGISNYNRIVAVVVRGTPLSEICRRSGRELEREVDRLLAALDRLAEHFGMKTTAP